MCIGIGINCGGVVGLFDMVMQSPSLNGCGGGSLFCMTVISASSLVELPRLEMDYIMRLWHVSLERLRCDRFFK